VVPSSPNALAHSADGPRVVLDAVAAGSACVDQSWSTGNHLVLRRGPYVVAAGMDESSQVGSLMLAGAYVNLYDPDLPIVVDPEIAPDTRWLLYDLSRCPDKPWVIAAAGRVENEEATECGLTFTVEGMADTKCVVRVRLPSAPTAVTVDALESANTWDAASRTLCLRFLNRPEGVSVNIVG
jgi:hypothetical protein